MANKDLFKQAIADAKSIREAAIANAKAALEESLTPQLKELLAQRLAEMEEETEIEEVLTEAEVEETEGMEEGDYSKEEVAEEAEEREEEGEEEAGEEEAEDDAEESEDEAEEIEDMTVEDLKDLIRDILSQEMDDMEEPAGEEGDEEAEDMVGMDMTAPEAEAGEEEIDIAELMAELAEMAKTDEETVEETINQAEADSDAPHGNLEEEGNLNETPDLLQIGAGLAALFAAAGGVAAVQSAAEAGKLGSAMKSIMGKITSTANTMGTNKPGSSDSVIREEELAEAMETIETLRKDLNEVNLLNAKLLYVNKVFKANNLTESQKANVIASFDKAETVKEVKLVFETVSENVTTGSKKEVVKEAKGFASAAVGVSDKPEVITEANEVVRRMQKLAGIIK